MSLPTIGSSPEAAQVTLTAVDALRALLGTDAGAELVSDNAIAKGGSGYCSLSPAAPARWTDFGRAADARADLGGFAAGLNNDELQTAAAEQAARAERALIEAAYLTELRVYRLTFEARLLGRAAGRAAGAWAADGNTDAEAARQVIALSDAGDDIDQYLPRRPDLSGEWADDATPTSLLIDLGIDDEDPERDALLTDCSDAWEAGVDDTFVPACLAEIARAAR